MSKSTYDRCQKAPMKYKNDVFSKFDRCQKAPSGKTPLAIEVKGVVHIIR